MLLKLPADLHFHEMPKPSFKPINPDHVVAFFVPISAKEAN